jgi:predicted transcriptional regulator
MSMEISVPSRHDQLLAGAGLRGRDVIKAVLAEHRIHPEDLFGLSREPHLVAARIDAAKQMRALGYSHRKIGEILKRDRTCITHYLDPKIREKKRRRLQQTRLFQGLSADVQSIVEQIAIAEGVSLKSLMAEWVSERALYEAEAKRRDAA